MQQFAVTNLSRMPECTDKTFCSKISYIVPCLSLSVKFRHMMLNLGFPFQGHFKFQVEVRHNLLRFAKIRSPH